MQMVFGGPLGKEGKKEIRQKGGKIERKKQGERERERKIVGEREYQGRERMENG